MKLILPFLLAPIVAFGHPSFETRIDDLTKAIDKAPYVQQLYLMRGQLYAGHGDMPRAKQDFESALKIEKNAKALTALGNLYLSEANYTRARDFFADALVADPLEARAWLGQAKAGSKLGSSELVLTGYRHFFALETNAQPGHFATAIRDITVHDRSEAQRTLEDGLERLGPIPTLTKLAFTLGLNL